MTDAIRALLRKHRELISYVFWGVMTTAVNYVTYLLLTKGFHVYKLFVFQSRDWAWRVALRELWQMVASRLFSLGLEMGILWLFVDKLHYNDAIVKLCANVVVVVVNYVLSKFIIFRKKAD